MHKSYSEGLTLIAPSRMTNRIKVNKGFTLIELLVVISIIAFLSSVVFATLNTARIKARDSARIQVARQIALALEQYEHSTNSYKVSNSGFNNEGGGYVAKGAETPGYTNSILSTLKGAGYMSSANLKDPVFGTDNYYVGLCTSTNAYNVFVKLEQSEYNQATSSIINTCGGVGAAAEGFSFIASVSGGSSGGGGFNATGTAGFAGVMEYGMGGPPVNFIGSVGSIDSVFNRARGASNEIVTAAVQSDGRIIIAGDFLGFDSFKLSRVARLNSDGSVDTSFNPGNGANDEVKISLIQSDGKILIGGDFTQYNDTPRNHIARLNTDGTLDTTFNPGSGANSGVRNITILSGGKILISGDFTTYNGISRKYIARINSDGTLDATFDPGVGPNSSIWGMSVQSDGNIIIGGWFTTYGGVGKNRIARISSTGTLDVNFNTGTGADNVVGATAIQSDGKIVIAGGFNTYEGASRMGIARLNTNGSLDATYNVGTGSNNSAWGLYIQPDNKVFITGGFSTYNGISRGAVARINTDGSLDSSLNQGTGTPNFTNNVVPQPDGKFLVFGNFYKYDGATRNRIARMNADGSLDISFNQSGGPDSSIYTLSYQPDGKIIIGGYFNFYSEISRNRIARLNSDGSLDSSFNPGSGANSSVYDSLIQPDGKIIISGDFTTYDGTARNRLARVNADGSLDASLTIGSGPDGNISTISIQSDEKIIAGGLFNNFNSTARSRIVRLNSNGSVDTSFNPGSGANNNVYASVIQPDGKIIIGGSFTSYNGTSRNRVARLNTDGSIDTSFNPGTGANNDVDTVLLQPDGKIVISGYFTTCNSVSKNRIARLNTDGSLDSSFNTGSGADYNIRTTSLQPDGKIIIGGGFSSYDGVDRVSLARINSDGLLDTDFEVGSGANDMVLASLVQPDGKIIVGGYFDSFNDFPAAYLLRFE